MPLSIRLRVGLIGAAIQASRSPAMHMDEGRELGLNVSYELFDLDFMPDREAALPRLLDMAEMEKFAGLNITHPCKQAVIGLLTHLSPDAEALGAVNTVVFADGARIGHNTDCFGFSESLSRFLPDAKLGRVLVLGAGGGGAAVAYALLNRRAERVTVYDVKPDRCEALVDRLSRRLKTTRLSACRDVGADMATCDGVVNCTPIGMHKYPGAPVPIELLRASMWVADIVYFPLETQFLAAARARGCAVLDGGAMAVFQAAAAFRLFSGREPDQDRMLSRFRRQATHAPQ
jgi:shikimate dehydrogenase